MRHSDIYLRRPVNSQTRRVTDQSRVSDTVVTPALDLHMAARSSSIGRLAGDQDLLKRVRQRITADSNVRELAVGDPFLVYNADGSWAYADRVVEEGYTGFRGRVKKRFFHVIHGMCATGDFYARSGWDDEPREEGEIMLKCQFFGCNEPGRKRNRFCKKHIHPAMRLYGQGKNPRKEQNNES